MVRVGCCGFQKAQHVYYEHFQLIELQQTFYKLPMLKTAERWRFQAPGNFVYTLKALQLITHEPFIPTYRRSGLDIPQSMWKYYGAFRPTSQVFDAWERTRIFARALNSPLVVFQCPPQFTPTPEHIHDMRIFFRSVERDALRFAWEPRGEWPNDTVRDLCQELDLIHCVDPFLGVSVYGVPSYYRMHGGADYSYKFTDADLAQLASLVENQPDAYCLFNNVHMWEDALRFREILKQRGTTPMS